MTDNAGADDEDLEGLGLAPVDDRPKGAVHDVMRLAEDDDREKRELNRVAPSKLPDWLYPFGIRGLGALVPMALWAVTAGGMWGMMLVWGQQAGPMALRALLPPAVILGLITGLFASACCADCMNATANDSEVDEWPMMGRWMEWSYVGLSVLIVFAQVLVAAMVLFCWTLLWTKWVPLTLAVLFLPLGMMAAAESNTWMPYSAVIFRSLSTQSRLWLLFHVKWAGMLGVWLAVSAVGVLTFNWWFLVVSAPLLVTVLLTTARLLGRVASQLSIQSGE